jgi:hypothetical protein
MFKKHDADCRRLPVRKGQPVAAAPVVEPAPVATPVVIEQPAPMPAKKPRRQKAPAPVVVVEPEPAPLYDYPFVERVEREEEPTPVAPEEQSEFHEYSFDLGEPMDHALPREDGALAYIVSPGAVGRPQGTEYYRSRRA